MADNRIPTPAMGTLGTTPATSTNTDAHIIQAADAARSKADTLSLQMYNLIGIVKLAAFAAEARRTLDAIRDLAHCRADVKQAIEDHVSAPSDWRERDDNAGEVLDYVARQLEEVNSEFTDAVHGLAWTIKTGGQQ